jgi:hypothetical protein
VKKNDPMNAINLDDTLEKMGTTEFQLVKRTNIRKLFNNTRATVQSFGNEW